MRAAQAGERGAYERLLRELSPFIRQRARALCRNSADLEELVQETLLTIHRVRRTYDPRRPFTPWVAAIVRRRSIDGLRRRRRIARLEVPDEGAADAAADPTVGLASAPALDGAGARAELAPLLRQLPQRQREALEMLKLREMSLAEASLTSGQTVGALKVNAHRGLKRLRSLVSGRARRGER